MHATAARRQGRMQMKENGAVTRLAHELHDFTPRSPNGYQTVTICLRAVTTPARMLGGVIKNTLFHQVRRIHPW